MTPWIRLMEQRGFLRSDLRIPEIPHEIVADDGTDCASLLQEDIVSAPDHVKLQAVTERIDTAARDSIISIAETERLVQLAIEWSKHIPSS